MADIPVTGRVRVAWVPTIADTAEPTVAELNAGLRIDGKLTAIEGFTATTNEVDTSKVNSRFDSKSPGTGAFSNSAFIVAEDDTDNAVLAGLEDDQLTSGYVVMRLNEDAENVWAAADEVDVYPATLGVVSRVDPGSRNTILRSRVPVTVNDDPVFRAVVAAS